jgi:ATP-dependent helicase YprA (DUF1998 family)
MTRFHKEVFEPYLDFLHVRYRFHSDYEHARRIWEAKLSAAELINGPYLEKAQSYRTGDPIESLGLHLETAETIKIKLKGRSLWKHQTEAIKRILAGKNTIIATGTSSGKTLCYQTPILDELVNHPGDGLRAIIIYPLNALVNDQLNEWEQLLTRHKRITFARFTGQTPDSQQTYVARCTAQIKDSLSEKKVGQQELQQEINRRLQEKLDKEKEEIPNRLNHRDAIRATPPNVLITNFSMLEYLLERPIDAPIFKNADLRFIVLDEVHAYRGVQATEIAFLIRRLKDRLCAKKVTCIGTSATLGKRGDPAVRNFATQLFNQPFDDENPIYGEAEPPALRMPSISLSMVFENSPPVVFEYSPPFGLGL